MGLLEDIRAAAETVLRSRTYDRHAVDEEVFNEGLDELAQAVLDAITPKFGSVGTRVTNERELNDLPLWTEIHDSSNDIMVKGPRGWHSNKDLNEHWIDLPAMVVVSGSERLVC